jgi:hypothetical protein
MVSRYEIPLTAFQFGGSEVGPRWIDDATDPRARNQAHFAFCLAQMTLMVGETAEVSPWPAGRFWDLLQLLTIPAQAAGGRALRGYECLPPAEACALFRCVLGPARPKVAFDPDWVAWNRGTVPVIARMIRTRGAYSDMPILADALQDAGCDAEELLAHCREPHHGCGCWVLNAILAAA